jgi:hypothetical protein
MRCIAAAALLVLLTGGAFCKGAPPARALTAAQIVAKNVAARGGLAGWRKVQTMVWVGHMESVNAPVPSMPFILQQQRPNKTHFELNTMNQRTLRVFDGTAGWKMRPDRSGKPEVQSFTAQEIKFAHDAQVIDGPLIDYEAKGNAVALHGMEKIEGRDAYRLDVHLASGDRENIWIDANTFLDVRLDRMSFNSAGMPGMVTVVYRKYQTVDGLQIPSIVEIGAGSGRTPDVMAIEKISLNPSLDERAFERPGAPHRRNAAAASGGQTPAPSVASPPAPPGGPANAQAESEAESR